jgi:hypothetical protein
MAWAYSLSPLKIRRGGNVGSGLARLLSRVVVNVIEHIAHKVTGLVIVIVIGLHVHIRSILQRKRVIF